MGEKLPKPPDSRQPRAATRDGPRSAAAVREAGTRRLLAWATANGSTTETLAYAHVVASDLPRDEWTHEVLLQLISAAADSASRDGAALDGKRRQHQATLERIRAARAAIEAEKQEGIRKLADIVRDLAGVSLPTYRDGCRELDGKPSKLSRRNVARGGGLSA